MKKYLVIPGNVISKNDGDEHYISANELIRLYGVQRDDCVIADPSMPRGYYSKYADLILLVPRYDGDYSL